MRRDDLALAVAGLALVAGPVAGYLAAPGERGPAGPPGPAGPAAAAASPAPGTTPPRSPLTGAVVLAPVGTGGPGTCPAGTTSVDESVSTASGADYALCRVR